MARKRASAFGGGAPATLVLLLVGLSLMLLTLLMPVESSKGDESPEFTKCSYFCHIDTQETKCKDSLALELKLMQWSCLDDCLYRCMWAHEATIAPKREKYFGKWAFIRILGVQEPASVVFSLLNLAAHVVGIRSLIAICRLRHEKWQALRGIQGGTSNIFTRSLPPAYITVFSLSNILLWICSTVFHTRDRPITEFLDYSCAAFAFYMTLAAIMKVVFNIRYRIGFFACVFFYYVHCFFLLRFFETYEQDPAALKWLAKSVFSTLRLLPESLNNSARRTGVRLYINYKFNVIQCQIIGLSSLFIMLVGCLNVRKRYPINHPKRDAPYAMAYFIQVMLLVSTIQFFDLPPLFYILDSHALWHFATIPVIPLCYRALQAYLLGGWHIKRAKKDSAQSTDAGALIQKSTEARYPDSGHDEQSILLIDFHSALKSARHGLSKMVHYALGKSE